MRIRLLGSLFLSTGLALAGTSWLAEGAQVKKKQESCAVRADKYAKNEQRKLIAKTALMGGTSAIFIGAIMSEFNKDGTQKAKGAFGGGQIGGKGAKLRMKMNYNKAFAACRAGRKV